MRTSSDLGSRVEGVRLEKCWGHNFCQLYPDRFASKATLPLTHGWGALSLRNLQESCTLNRNNPGDADLGHRSQPIDQLSGVMLKVANVIELQFQLAERQPEES